MDNCILLSIRKNWAAAILSGEKKLEIRKCAPSYNPNTEKRAEYARFVHNLDANHCNVWLSNEPTGGHSIHPTQKPVDLLERAIRTHTRPGAVVCDFFAGSGSTGVAALKAGRRYILIEQSAGYYEKGLAWLEETKSALCT